MKKLVLSVLAAVVLTTFLTACGKFTCGICLEEKSGSKKQAEFFGEKVDCCSDCYKELKELKDSLEELENLLG